jgi:hypothetical protein
MSLDQSNRSGWQSGRDGQFARHYPAAAGRNQQQVGGLHLRRAVRLYKSFRAPPLPPPPPTFPCTFRHAVLLFPSIETQHLGHYDDDDW